MSCMCCAEHEELHLLGPLEYHDPHARSTRILNFRGTSKIQMCHLQENAMLSCLSFKMLMHTIIRRNPCIPMTRT